MSGDGTQGPPVFDLYALLRGPNFDDLVAATSREESKPKKPKTEPSKPVAAAKEEEAKPKQETEEEGKNRRRGCI
jgi:hypothetical protein